MPINDAGAKATLGALFSNPVDTEAAAITQWGSALNTLMAAVVPASTTVAAGVTAFQAAIVGFGDPDQAKPKLEAALTTFASTVAGGMTAAGYTGAPPAGPIVLTFPEQNDAQAAADAIIDTLKAWFITGTATLIVPPNTVVPWS